MLNDFLGIGIKSLIFTIVIFLELYKIKLIKENKFDDVIKGEVKYFFILESIGFIHFFLIFYLLLNKFYDTYIFNEKIKMGKRKKYLYLQSILGIFSIYFFILKAIEIFMI